MITINFNKISLTPEMTVLDLGCGSGRHVDHIARFPDLNITGIDQSILAIQEARQRIELLIEWHLKKSAICLMNADSLALPFNNHCFDLIICSEVLEHILHHETALKEIYRVLKPGKQLIISVPRYWPERICWSLSTEYCREPQGHVRIYTKPHLLSLLNKTGFKMEHSHYAHSLHVPYWWFKCILEKKGRVSKFVQLYHRLLVWDLMKKPFITQFCDKLLNPFMGKSIVLYCRKS
jgi:ubiquinone/menaquinone biosynthesis C-methylase UbiE